MGSFDSLSPLDEKLSKKGNQAESRADDPEDCFSSLRGFVSYLLQFLERRHSIPPPRAEDLGKLGLDQYRINRLTKYGVRVTERQLSALHLVRKYGNRGSHAPENVRFHTEEHVEKALNYTRLVSDWLCAQYGRETSVEESSGKSPDIVWESTHQNAAAATVAESFWFDDVDLPQQTTIEPSPASPPETNQRVVVEGEDSSTTSIIFLLVGIVLFVCGTAYIQLNKVAASKPDSKGQANNVAGPKTEREMTGSTNGLVVSYENPCGSGRIFRGARCFQIPSGPVDLSLSAGDIFGLPLGQAGYLTTVAGGLFVQDSQSGALRYAMPGKRIFVTSAATMKAEKDGTRAEFRPEQ